MINIKTITKDKINTKNQKNNSNNDLLKYFTKKELEDSAKELDYMEKHLDEYKSFDNIKNLKNDLLNND